ncbi:Phosphoethanolamine N-methyltransferase-related protein [Tritrichomonas foetus]|uniref:Phosphoethanolamine N-methyltransferase-related protein n=1 Tax=Tritrichomonas foetus TaxID=1144522 RepID=A0A1J4KYL6_9EUKA|nr:Phosphoethanolamine N-methyltransferase-related protein [Tritrichomonas foetus]|eukprot:OHT14798.1 Phosphoethanolamine N-methyltransferase-related protein [Tritrichomonas foetus]
MINVIISKSMIALEIEQRKLALENQANLDTNNPIENEEESAIIISDEEVEKQLLELENSIEADEEIGEIDEFDQTIDKKDYSNANYWDERYINEDDLFDWYFDWNKISEKIMNYIQDDEICLNLGCGNAKMAVDMEMNPFKYVINIDISHIVIEKMSKRYDIHPNLLFYTMDCSDLKFENDMFDCIIDKGTFDALMCGDSAKDIIYRSMKEIYRALKPGGKFIEISFGKPEKRIPFLKGCDLDWNCEEPVIFESRRNTFHYGYIFIKKE